jgi:hypothetical protein
MPTELAQQFRAQLREFDSTLRRVSPQLADVPWRDGGWTRKQVMGHMLDSAANNRQRFVRAAIDGAYQGPSYGQQEWVAAHGYALQSWQTLLRWWQVEHEILAAIVDQIPEGRLEAACVVEGNAPVTLRWLIQDYLHHQRGHVDQLTTDPPR